MKNLYTKEILPGSLSDKSVISIQRFTNRFDMFGVSSRFVDEMGVEYILAKSYSFSKRYDTSGRKVFPSFRFYQSTAVGKLPRVYRVYCDMYIYGLLDKETRKELSESFIKEVSLFCKEFNTTHDMIISVHVSILVGTV